MAIIALEGMEFRAHIGYYQEERLLKGRFQVDLYVDSNFGKAAESDELSGTINYESLYAICAECMKEPCDLLEYAAEQIMRKCKATHPEIQKMKIRLSKLDPPLPGKVARSYVEVDKSFASN